MPRNEFLKFLPVGILTAVLGASAVWMTIPKTVSLTGTINGLDCKYVQPGLGSNRLEVKDGRKKYIFYDSDTKNDFNNNPTHPDNFNGLEEIAIERTMYNGSVWKVSYTRDQILEDSTAGKSAGPLFKEWDKKYPQYVKHLINPNFKVKEEPKSQQVETNAESEKTFLNLEF